MTAPTQDPEWLAWRNKGLGASDIAAAFTRSYGNTPRSIVARKLGIGPPVEVTDAMLRGHEWEDRINAAVKALLGWHVAGEQMWCSNPAEPWMRCTPDGLAFAHEDDAIDDAVAIVEDKTTDRSHNWRYYAIQTQWQMMTLGIDMTILAVLDLNDDAWLVDVGGGAEVLAENSGSLRIVIFRADPTLQAQLLEFGRELWAHVQAGTLPDIEADDYDAIKAENPDATNTDAADLSHLDDVATGYVRTKAALKAALAEEKRLAAILTDAIGAHETADVHGVTWFTRKANTKGARSLLTTKEAKASC